MPVAEIELLPADAAPATLDEVVDVINAAYADGEAGLWLDGTTRIGRAQAAEEVGAGGMLVARAGGRMVGCASVRRLDDETFELGLVSALPEAWGSGVGRVLADTAEELARSAGARQMQLQVLVPRTGEHPNKVRLRSWYERRGYRIAGTKAFTAERLARPCEFLVFRKPLA
jgi:GNAT superfamily N-acetyltransferase